jgi:Na+-transporting NADH:ubiquinone oxidoreductase subunit C
MNRSIVTAMEPSFVAGDVLTPTEVVQRFSQLDILLIDLKTGARSRAADPLLYDFFTAEESPELQYNIPPSMDVAGLVHRPTLAPVYRLYEGVTLQRVGLPIYGPGMWSRITGYIVLEDDYNTIANIYFYQQGETPGIGDQIESPEWRKQWVGKKTRNKNGDFKFRQRKSTQVKDTDEYQIDAISGATVTSAAVILHAQYWLGDDGYGPYIAKQLEEDR